MTRHFYRCKGCLEIMTTEAPLPMEWSYTVTGCANCGEKLESLGRVHRNRLVMERLECKCDERCTSAKGPLCACACGGENHGAGMLGGYITVMTDKGPVPALKPASEKRAAKALANFLAFKAAKAPLLTELNALLDRRAAGEFLPRASFLRMLELRRLNGEIGKLRSHHGRMKALAELATAPAAA